MNTDIINTNISINFHTNRPRVWGFGLDLYVLFNFIRFILQQNIQMCNTVSFSLSYRELKRLVFIDFISDYCAEFNKLFVTIPAKSQKE